MNHPAPIPDLCSFLEEHYTACLAWPEGRLRDWVAWHQQIGGVGIIRQGGALVGVALARLVKDPEAANPWEHDDHAQSVFVDLVATAAPGAMGRMWRLIIDRFGYRQQIAFKRRKYRNRVSVYPYADFLAHLQQVQPGVIYG